jgi:hypothetical protein
MGFLDLMFPISPPARLGRLFRILSLAGVWAGVTVSLRAETQTVFGRQENTGAALIGILYDFKQNQKLHSTGFRPDQFPGILGEFLDKGWSESVLNRYFRATRPLYATQIFIPQMGAEHAPKAFGLEQVIRPSGWIVCYKGQVAPPEDGTYRFLAYADDLIIVGVNQQIVCLAGRPDSARRFSMWKVPPQGPEIPAANGNLVYGDWLDLKKDEPIDLDVIVGERPGGKFSAFLLYEKQGAVYPVDGDGRMRYPIFQLSAGPSTVPAGENAPPHCTLEPTWTGLP